MWENGRRPRRGVVRAPGRRVSAARTAAIVERTDVACSELLEADEWLATAGSFTPSTTSARRADLWN